MDTADIARFAYLEISTTGIPGMLHLLLRTRTANRAASVPADAIDGVLDAIAQHLPRRPTLVPGHPPGRAFTFLMQTGPNPHALFRFFDWQVPETFLPAPHKDELREFARDGFHRLGVVEELAKLAEVMDRAPAPVLDRLTPTTHSDTEPQRSAEPAPTPTL